MKQSHWLLCVAKNYDWLRKITPPSYFLTRAPLYRGMKTCSESRTELKILQILQKTFEMSSQFLSSE